ncbi:MAG: pro-sigmaK processing inhibitor BofA family protein [Clostridium sp.]|uniref:pro-sigmaK processing inhibitor BofA family protein n=1 Tax=Clostridium TaxID=1485 RepID=UPI00188370A7|nr:MULTISPECIES: pro-sigmaK processing inhibitor BofA family protein [Clostridium]MCR6516033.1 pro-sigmaK processing inhibitor BofA family protein [Clostridium sp. LY3-2]
MSNGEIIIYGLVGVVILYVLLKLLKWPIKLLINGIAGVIALYIVNLLGASFGISIGINIFTALIAGILGLPGIIALILFQMFF